MEAPGASEVPTYSQCVIGYRAWRADADGRLWPIGDRRRPWVPGINSARCNCASARDPLRFEWSAFDGKRRLEPAPLHRAPAARCVCGLYSWRYPRQDWHDMASHATPPHVVGAVACWGTLHVHGEGFRAEHACAVTLAHRDDIEPEALTALESIAARYRVDLVRLDDLVESAGRHGARLPDEVGPPPTQFEPADGQPPEPPMQIQVVPHPAPDATPDDVGSPVALGFDGRPLRQMGTRFSGGGVSGA